MDTGKAPDSPYTRYQRDLLAREIAGQLSKAQATALRLLQSGPLELESVRGMSKATVRVLRDRGLIQTQGGRPWGPDEITPLGREVVGYAAARFRLK